MLWKTAMHENRLPFAFDGSRDRPLSSWIDEVLPDPWRCQFLVRHCDQILRNNLFATITAPPAQAYQASLYLALTLVTQKKAFFEPWDRAFPFPQFFRSLQAELGGRDFFALSLDDVFSPLQAEKIDNRFSVLIYYATAIKEIEQAALISAFLLFNKKNIMNLLADYAAGSHVFSSPAQMAGQLSCPTFLQPWVNGQYAPVFTQALDKLFGMLTRTTSPFTYKILAEFVFAVLLHRKRYLRGPVYHKSHHHWFSQERRQSVKAADIASQRVYSLVEEEYHYSSGQSPTCPRK
jgi:hypothetical protein